MWLEWGKQARWALGLAIDSWRAASDPVPSESRDPANPILLLHGFAGTPRMLRPLGRFLHRELGRPVWDPVLGLGLGDIRDLADRVHAELIARHVARCDVVAYSMGGLVATYLAKCLDHGLRIGRIVTLGTPHRGVPLASDWRLRWAGWCRAAAQMRVGSTFLTQLQSLPLSPNTRLLSIAGERDALVPPTAARVSGRPGANLVVPGIDHWSLLTSRRVYRCVRDALPAPGSAHREREASAEPRRLPAAAAAVASL